MTSQAPILNKISDQKLLFFPIIEPHKRQQIPVRQPPKPPHMLVKFVPARIVHLPESPHDVRLPRQQHGFVRRPEAPTSQHLSRRFQKILQLEPLPVVFHELNPPVLIIILVTSGYIVGLFDRLRMLH